jgi:anti-anti-sigma factor
VAFNVVMQMTDRSIARISLSGELDASAAPAFRSSIENAAAQGAKRLVLLMHELNYIASAGLRVLVFAKQKMGPGRDIHVVAPQEQVLESLELTGLRHSLVIMNEYDEEKITGIEKPRT